MSATVYSNTETVAYCLQTMYEEVIDIYDEQYPWLDILKDLNIYGMSGKKLEIGGEPHRL